MAAEGPTSTGSAGVRVETGTIADVNARNWTVGWASQYSGSYWPAVQLMAPYLHYNNGEGFYCLPEVGAVAAVCFPSDEQNQPFILGFLSAFEREGAQIGNLQAAITNPGLETEETSLPTANTTTSSGSTSPNAAPADASRRAGRPILTPGDMVWQGRDENFVILRRGGVLQIGSTQVCQRMYIPVRNFIRDFCENYELNTAAGSLSWVIQRAEDKPAPSQTPNELNLILREYVQDKKASVRLSFGSLDKTKNPSPPGGGDTWVALEIAPGGIEPADGKVSGSSVFTLRIDKQGNSYVMQAGVRTEEIKGDLNQKVTGNVKQEIGGNLSVKTGGTVTEDFGGAHTVKGPSSDENWSGAKTIVAAALRLGAAAAAEPVPLGSLWLAWAASHIHPTTSPGAPTGPPTVPPTAAMLSGKVFVTK